MSLNFPQAWLSLLLSLGLPVVAAIFAVALAYFLSRPAQQAVVRWLPRTAPGAATVAPLLGQAVRYGIIVFGVVTALGFIGVPQASVFAVLGAAGLAVALALQNTLANVAAGIMLAWIRPVAVGEYIAGDGVEGEVIEIGLFGTRLRSATGLYLFTPNNKLWNGAITNHSREPRRRVDVTVTIPDSADIALVRRTLLGLVGKDRRVLVNPAPTVHVDSFGAGTVSLQMRAWVKTPDYRAVLRDTTEAAKTAVDRLLAEAGGEARVVEATDPHLAATGGRTPDLDPSEPA